MPSSRVEAAEGGTGGMIGIVPGLETETGAIKGREEFYVGSGGVSVRFAGECLKRWIQQAGGRYANDVSLWVVESIGGRVRAGTCETTAALARREWNGNVKFVDHV